jgi:hypothetical protein
LVGKVYAGATATFRFETLPLVVRERLVTTSNWPGLQSASAIAGKDGLRMAAIAHLPILVAMRSTAPRQRLLFVFGIVKSLHARVTTQPPIGNKGIHQPHRTIAILTLHLLEQKLILFKLRHT